MLIIEVRNNYCKRGEYPPEYKDLIQQIKEAIEKLPHSSRCSFAFSADVQIIDIGTIILAATTHIVVYADDPQHLDAANEVLKDIECKKFFRVFKDYVPKEV
uniref:Uncharacterized protein n=1 Tax=candidate division CPR3 bacterium TaxID=2268181 RepID=A0A7C4R5P4_UNCC3